MGENEGEILEPMQNKPMHSKPIVKKTLGFHYFPLRMSNNNQISSLKCYINRIDSCNIIEYR